MRWLVWLSILGAMRGPLQELPSADQLRRVRWSETQAALAEVYPARLRHGGIAGSPVVAAGIAATGSVIASQLLVSSGHKQLDDAALQAAMHFHFAAPVSPGTYQLRVPFDPDSLIPQDPALGCLPPAALTAVAMSYLSLEPASHVDRQSGSVAEVPSGHYRELRFDGSEAGAPACASTFSSWPTERAEGSLPLGAGVRFCPWEGCTAVPGAAATPIQLRIVGVRQTWPREWSFRLESPREIGPWVVRCLDEFLCDVAVRTRAIP